MLKIYYKELQNPYTEIGDAGFKLALTFKQQLALKFARWRYRIDIRFL